MRGIGEKLSGDHKKSDGSRLTAQDCGWVGNEGRDARGVPAGGAAVGFVRRGYNLCFLSLSWFRHAHPRARTLPNFQLMILRHRLSNLGVSRERITTLVLKRNPELAFLSKVVPRISERDRPHSPPVHRSALRRYPTRQFAGESNRFARAALGRGIFNPGPVLLW